MLNEARGKFSGGGGVRRLLTAAVAVVLLLALSGTAEAQAQPSVSFSETTGVVKEDTVANITDFRPARYYRVTVTKTGDVGTVGMVSTPLFTNYNPGNRTLSHGSLNYRMRADPDLGPVQTGLGTVINFNAQNQAVLTIAQGDEAQGSDWADAELIVSLRARAGTRIGPDLKLKIDDRHATPTATFSKTSMRLTEDSAGDGAIKLEYPAGEPRPRMTVNSFNEATGMGRNRLHIKVEPPDGIGTAAAPTGGPVQFRVEGRGIGTTDNDIKAVADMPGRFTLPVTVWEANRTNGTAFEVRANPDKAGFRNPKVTISLVAFDTVVTAGTRAGRPGGPVKAGPPLVIEVISDEAVPTVYFSPTDISIKEGGRTTAALVSEGKQGAEVNTVKLAVDGNAMVDLYRGSAKLAPKDGLITVDLKDTNLARLTARSTSDRSLLDGQMKSKTWRITDADGANIDTSANALTVTVEGSTAVPALPLVAQLLLALFLAAGGARLYRRRR